MTLTEFIINDITPVSESQNIGDVQSIFSQTTYSHVPIQRDGVYVGSLPENDTHCLGADTAISDFSHAYMHFFVRYETNWLDVLEAFAQNGCNLMPGLDDNNTYLGYYELEDVMRFFNNTPFISEPGSVVIIEKGVQDYSFSEISQIVESNDGKIWGIFISNIENDVAEISLKIGRSNFNDILSAFRRYSYNIISSHQEDSFLIDLRKRSQYLDKYLNI
jgi:hypothetical protein